MTFGVDTETMAGGAARIGVAAERIDDLLNRMRADVNQMLGGWSGEGADAHRGLHMRYEADVVAINENLRIMQEALLQTRSIYLNQENEQQNDHVSMRGQIL